MLKFSRRSMLAQSLIATAAFATGGKGSLAGDEGAAVRGKLLYVGNRPELLPHLRANDVAEEKSVLCSLDLDSGEQTAQSIPIGQASAVVALHDGRMVCVGPGRSCVVLGATGAPLTMLEAPEGHIFTGGMCLDHAQRHLTLAMVNRDAHPHDMNGRLWRVSLDTFATLIDTPSGGKWPHAFFNAPEANEVYVLHSGVGAPKRDTPAGLKFEPVDPKITIFDAELLTSKRDVPLCDIDGMPSSLVVRNNGQAVVGLSQFQRFPTKGDDGQFRSLTARMTYATLFEGYAPVQQPLVVLDLGSVPVRQRMVGGECQHEAMTVNLSTGTLVATFSNSDRVLFLDRDGAESLLDACDLGLTEVAGVAALAGTQYVALAGRHRYVVIVDTMTMRVVRRYRTENYGATQMTYRGEV